MFGVVCLKQYVAVNYCLRGGIEQDLPTACSIRITVYDLLCDYH